MKKQDIALFISILALAIALWTLLRPQVENKSEKSFYNDFINQDIPNGFVAKSFDLPEELSFAGEVVPLEKADVRERLDRELHVNTFFHSNTIFLIKRSNQWLPTLASVLEEEKIPEDFIYIAIIESGLQNVVSPSNAVGFWQILKATAEELGLEVNKEVDERYDAVKSTRAAAKYLRKAYEKFGSWTDAAASYNVGIRGLTNIMEDQKADSYYDLAINEETARYVFRALAVKLILSDPQKYGYDVPKKHLYVEEKVRDILVKESISDLAQWAKDQGVNYRVLRRHNPWLRQNKLTIKKGEEYTIRLPK